MIISFFLFIMLFSVLDCVTSKDIIVSKELRETKIKNWKIDKMLSEDERIMRKKRGRRNEKKYPVRLRHLSVEEKVGREIAIQKGKERKEIAKKKWQSGRYLHIIEKIKGKQIAIRKKWNIKISSWNVNGIRPWIRKGGHKYIASQKPDIICLQKTMCPEKNLPPEANISGYFLFYHEGPKRKHAGVAVYTRFVPNRVSYYILDQKDEAFKGRIITVQYSQFYLVNVFIPNARKGVKNKAKKKKWDKKLYNHIRRLEKRKPVILAGGINVAHKGIDLADPGPDKHNPIGASDFDRQSLTDLLNIGLIDSFRYMYSRKVAYTYWPAWGRSRKVNRGWRMDYFIISRTLYFKLADSIMLDCYNASEHCPIVVYLLL